MKFRTTENEEPELNLVPLIDVLLMTLIFLIVTTTFSKESQLKIKLPEASSEVEAVTNALTVTIDPRGQYFINEKQLIRATPAALRNALLQAAGGKKDPGIVIYADAKTPHQSVVSVMDAARRLGFTHLTFATQQPVPSNNSQ